MKKLILISTTFFIFFSVIFVACKKVDISENINNKDDEKIFMIANFVSNKHNEYLTEMLEDYNYSEINRIKEFKNCFYNSHLDNLSIDSKDIIWNNFKNKKSDSVEIKTIEDFLYTIDTTNIITHKRELKDLVYSSQNIISKLDTLTYSNFENEIDILINNTISQNLSEDEIIIALTYLLTAKNSAYFWISEQKGGDGLGYKYFRKINTTKISPLGSALISDCSSVGIGMISVAVAGAMSGVGVLIFVAAEAAAGSGLAAAVAALK